jgi:hypothetical protein
MGTFFMRKICPQSVPKSRPRPRASGSPEMETEMFTSIDKALVALVMALIYVANTFLGINFGITEETVQTIVALVTPVLVWLVPNKAA